MTNDEVNRWKLSAERIVELRGFIDQLLSTHNMYECIAIRDMLSEEITHEPSEQLPAELAWGLESKLPGEDWKVYWALYSDRARAEQAAKNGRPEGTEWRVVTYARMPDGASGDASSESSDHPFDVACACQLCRDKLAEWNAEKSSEQQENKNGN